MINCTSTKYKGHVAMKIRLRPNNSTNNHTEVCKGLPEITGLMTEAKFPVKAGTSIKVGCKEGTTLKGSYWIRCIRDYKFDFGEEKPRCEGSTTEVCKSLPEIPYLMADTKFPVKAGIEFKVRCRDGKVLKGNHVL